MNFRSLANNTAFAFLSQFVSFLASVVTSLLVPKVFGVEEFGYWQLFIFYVSYVGFFSLGAIDGLYLIHGGESRDVIDKRGVISQYWLSVCYVTLFSLTVGLVGALLLFDGKRAEVLLFTSLYSIASHLAASLGIILQTMNETKAYSRSVMIDRGSFVILLVVPLFLRIDAFEIYTVLYIVAKLLCLLYCLYKMRDFMTVGLDSLPVTLQGVWRSIRVGIKLTVSNIASSLILGVARALIDAAWGIEVFGKVSFALSIVNFFLMFVSQASMVLFPALRQGTEAERRSFYRGIRDMMEVAFPGIYLLYFPAVWLLTLWLPQYEESMHYFAILLPMCAFDTKMDVCCTTYLKVLREERTLLRVNVVAVVVSTVLSLVGIYAFGSLDAVLLGVTACIVGRSLWSERHLDGRMCVPSTLVPLEEVALTVAFVALTLLAAPPVAICAYAALYLLYLFVNRDVTRGLIASTKRVLGIG